MNTQERNVDPKDKVAEQVAETAPPWEAGTQSFFGSTPDGSNAAMRLVAGDRAGQTLGDYELLDKLGAGGMGVVYRARQRSANRIVHGHNVFVLEPGRGLRLGDEPPQRLGAGVRGQRRQALRPDAQAQRDLWFSFYKLGDAERAGKQFEKAIAWYEKAAEQVKAIEQAGRLAPVDKNVLTGLDGLIQQCRHATTALGDWKTLLEQPPKLLPVLLEMRGTESVQAGRIADAVQAVAKLRELGTATPGQLYNAACVYSLCAAAIKPQKDAPLTTDQSAARQQHIADALGTLREAIAAGWKDFAHMQKDPDLAPLRDLPEFQELIKLSSKKAP